MFDKYQKFSTIYVLLGFSLWINSRAWFKLKCTGLDLVCRSVSTTNISVGGSCSRMNCSVSGIMRLISLTYTAFVTVFDGSIFCFPSPLLTFWLALCYILLPHLFYFHLHEPKMHNHCILNHPRAEQAVESFPALPRQKVESAK